MTREKFATLWAYMDSQDEIIDSIFSKIESMKPLNEEQWVNLAYQLHNLYSAYEDVFKEISETFENNIERSIGFHKNLLTRMKISIPGIRPNLLSNESFHLLGEMMGFRHVFRHAYNYNLSPDKMQILFSKVKLGKALLLKDFSQFKKFLEENFKAL